MLEKKFQTKFITFLIILFFGMCSSSNDITLPSSFNNCEVSLNSALDELKSIKEQNSLNFEYRIVREQTTRDECVDMVLGTNLPQGSAISDSSLIDLVVGVKKDEITESVIKSEYELYMQQIMDMKIENLNLLDSQLFGEGKISNYFEGVGVISHISHSNPLGYDVVFSVAEGIIYGLKNGIQETLLDVSDITKKESEAGLHSFNFFELENNINLTITYSGLDNYYYFSSYEVKDNVVNLSTKKDIAKFETNENKVHFGGKILKYKETAVLCLGDLNSPGNSAKFDTPWGKIISLDFKSGYESTFTNINSENIDVIAYGFRNPWSCFLENETIVVPDVGNSHWEEINFIENFEAQEEPQFYGWPWLESFFDANYTNEPVSNDIKEQQLQNNVKPSYIFPHANGYCAVIGGTDLNSSRKWNGYVFVGDFCTGTIWAIDHKQKTKLKILDKDIIPYSITTIQDSGNETLLVGTTSGSIFEINLP